MTTSFLGNVKAGGQNSKPNAYSNVLSIFGDSVKKQTLKCFYCHKGHTKETCLKLVGYPPRGQGRGKQPNSNTSQDFETHPQSNVQASCVGLPNGNDQGTSVGSSGNSQIYLEQLQQ